jgi:ADP-ribosyl-[dinitrogen reductase] hydrolase
MNDRRRGALIGLAVGDALGAAVEFKSPGSFKPVTGFPQTGSH